MKFVPIIRFAFIIIFLLFVLMGIFGLSACNAVKKYQASPDFAKDCGDRFPPRTVQGKPDTITLASITIDCDSVVAANRDTVRLTNVVTIERLMPTSTGNRVTCPPQVFINQTDTIYNTAREEALVAEMVRQQKAHDAQVQKMEAQNQKLQAKNDKTRKQRNWLFWIVVAFLVGTFRHQIIGAISKFKK
jgi:uncharacterized membrane protein